MSQKIIKVGSSAAVTIPKKTLEDLNLHIGDKVSVDADKKRNGFFVGSNMLKVDKEIMDWTNKFIETYRPALEALSKK
jgi:putative addiction module antidote